MRGAHSHLPLPTAAIAPSYPPPPDSCPAAAGERLAFASYFGCRWCVSLPLLACSLPFAARRVAVCPVNSFPPLAYTPRWRLHWAVKAWTRRQGWRWA